MNTKFYWKGCKSLSQLKERIIKGLTHGDVFRWHGEPNEFELIEQSRNNAELVALQWIKNELHLIPSKIKRDIFV